MNWAVFHKIGFISVHFLILCHWFTSQMFENPMCRSISFIIRKNVVPTIVKSNLLNFLLCFGISYLRKILCQLLSFYTTSLANLLLLWGRVSLKYMYHYWYFDISIIKEMKIIVVIISRLFMHVKRSINNRHFILTLEST